MGDFASVGGDGGGSTGRQRILIDGSPFSSLADLETYSQTNPSELINSTSGVSIAVVDGDSVSINNGTYDYGGVTGIYGAGEWVKISSSLDPADVALLDDLKAVSNGRMLIKTAGGLVDAPARMLNQVMIFDTDVQIPSASLRIDDLLVLSEQTGFMGITNNVTQATFSIVDSRHTRTEGSFNPNVYWLTINTVVITNFTPSVVGDDIAMIPYAITGAEWNAIYAANSSQLTYVIQDSSTDEIIYSSIAAT